MAKKKQTENPKTAMDMVRKLGTPIDNSKAGTYSVRVPAGALRRKGKRQ